jgi:hypothetical protein
MKRLTLQSLFVFFLIFFFIFFLFQKVSPNLVFAQEVHCIENGVEYNPGETIDCNDWGEKTCQENGSWSDCQRKAGAGPCCDENGNYRPSSYICDSERRTQYKCKPNDQCGNKVLMREQIRYRYCPGDSDQCTGTWGPWETIPSSETETQCQEWQKCKNGDWTTEILNCQCAGECLEIPGPDNGRYYNNPNYPTDPLAPEEGEDSLNILLPVKFDWDDVEGWGQENGPQSYLIRIENTNQNTFEELITESEFIPESCLLKSNATHHWQVRACCGSDKGNCGEGSNWSFTSHPSPELVSPSDPDWGNPQIIEEVSIPDPAAEPILDWCDVEEAQSYRLRIHYIDRETEEELCHPWLKSNGGCDSLVVREERRPPPYPPEIELYSSFLDREGFFTKDTEYRWEVAFCLREDGTGCKDFGQKWGFKTGISPLQEFGLISPPNDPNGNRAVELPITLDWQDKPGINSFIYEINPGKISGVVGPSQVNFNYPTLSLNTLYRWKVKPCWDWEGQYCEEDWTEEWYFKTTGAAPELIYPTSDALNVPIPVEFDWEDVSGAKSYNYEVASDPGFVNIVARGLVEDSNLSLDYPGLKMLTDYWWRVKTCADREGSICGGWTKGIRFKTFKLSSPSSPLPEDNGEIFTYQMPITFSWSQVQGARFYRYKINYILKSSEEIGECPLEKVAEKIVNQASDLVSLNCLGNYQWQVQACLDENCQETGDWSSLWSFTLSQKAVPGEKGLVPCGRTYDDPDTPWNEREPCQIKHLFLLLRNLINFLLWQVSLLVLVFLVIATGIIYYFSMGAPATIVNIREVWKAAGKGYALIFLAWIIVNLILILFGYKIGIFGHWWQISL